MEFFRLEYPTSFWYLFTLRYPVWAFGNLHPPGLALGTLSHPKFIILPRALTSNLLIK